MEEFDSLQQAGRFFSALARDLKSQALSNIQFFQDGKQSYHAKFHTSFCLLYDYLDLGIEPSFRELSNYVHLFDFSRETKGNGFRSLLHVVQKCCLHLLQLVRYISNMRDSILFRKKFYVQELDAYVSAIGQLRALLYYALKLLNYCENGCLFTDSDVIDNEVAQGLMLEIEELNQECFYGRCLGFQFCSSMVRPLQALAIAMASYSEGYLETSSVMQMATSVFNSGKYFLDPELRAEQIVKATRTSDIRFCKALWGLTETGLMLQLPAFVCPSVEVDEAFPLGPDAFELPVEDGSDTVVITPPCAHTGPSHVHVRLISSFLRDGQQSLKKATKSKGPPSTKPRTDGLVIHIHGGGFVAHSSKSHEVYLRDWAHVFNVPILSVDYSLSPEMPFPRALEECFYAYAWAVKNCEQLGSTGKSIVLVGDSAGGNLVISTAMRAASFGIRRPEGVVSIYGVTMVSYTPSPARLLSLMDPLLSFGLVSRCLAAYAGISEEHPLATPQSEELHSKSSLSSLQMQTMEATDQEWIIIAQNRQECLEIDQKLVASPVTETRERSVVDSLEDSFHGDVDGEERKLERSDTVESEEVEIFSQLAAAGSCVFPKESRKTKPTGPSSGKDSNSNTQSQDFQDHVTDGKDAACNSGSMNGLKSRDGKSTTTLGGIQETAKNVVAGAQSMFSSLTSYIPKRSKTGASGVLSPVTYDLPAAITPDIDCFVDLSYNSDPVDISSKVIGSELSEAVLVSDSSQNVSESTSESKAHLKENGGHFPKMSAHMDCASLESEVSDGDARFSPSKFIQDADMSEREMATEPEMPMKGTGLTDDSDLSKSPSASSFKEDKGQSENSDSCAFKSALHSPVLGPATQALSQSCLESPAVIDVNTTATTEISKPTLGMSPNADTIPSNGHSNNPQAPTSIPTLCDNRVTASLSSPPIPNPDGHRPLSELPPSSHEDNNHGVCLTAENNGPISLHAHALSPSHPPSFSQDDFIDNTNSLQFMPSLPPENKELLEDAIQTADFWAEDSADCNSEKLQALSSLGEAKTVPAENGLESNIRAPGGRAVANYDSKTKSLGDGNNTVPYVSKDDSRKKDVALLSMEKREDCRPGAAQTSLPCRSAARPPCDLKLARTTSAILPGMSQANIDSVLSSDEPDFDRSCLEFLTPSSTVNNGCPEGQSQGKMIDGIFRSESEPALSSLLTPSPLVGPNPTPAPPHRSGLNGIKMGMSPSDFKRRVFTTQSPLKTMKKAKVVRNPYMSPFLATEELLRGLPPVTLVASHLDPLLDDSIMFAKRLKSYNIPVDLHLVDDLPHGFLNFSLISSEAKQASRFCAQKVLDLLEKSV